MSKALYRLKSGRHARGKGEVFHKGDTFTPTPGELRSMGDRLIFVQEIEDKPKPARRQAKKKPTEIQRKEEASATEAPTEQSVSEFPKHTGGGWYELSNGEKEALMQQEELNNGKSGDGE